MDTDRFFEQRLRDETLIKRRPWYVLAVALAVLSVITHQPVVFLVALFALVIGIVPEIWYRRALRHLVVRQQTSQQCVDFGELLTLSISVENQKVLPLPWLEVEDEIPAQLTLLTGRAAPTYKANRDLLTNALALWSFQRVTRRYQFRCLKRGVYTLGPMLVRSGDPFGWLVREEQVLASNKKVLVYPLIAPLELFGLDARYPFGEQTTPQRLLEDPLRIAGVREYQVGDDPRRIHWKATARAGALRSKIYEPSSQYRLLILLDVRTFPEPWMGIDEELQELTISLAASLAMWGLDEDYLVGLLANSLTAPFVEETGETFVEEEQANQLTRAGEEQTFLARVSVAMARGDAQRERLLTTFGRLIPYLGAPLEALLAAEGMKVPGGTTVVFVGTTAVLQETTIASLLELRRQGAAVHLLLTGETELHLELDELSWQVIGGREVWHELVENAGRPRAEAEARGATTIHLA